MSLRGRTMIGRLDARLAGASGTNLSAFFIVGTQLSSDITGCTAVLRRPGRPRPQAHLSETVAETRR
jgi:hypothetical protein